MADFCYFCKKKIGLLGKLSSETVERQIVCGACADKVKRISMLYNRSFSEYSLKDMRILIESNDSFNLYLNEYAKIDEEYAKKIRPYKESVEKNKADLKEQEKIRRKDKEEYEKELKKAEEEWRIEQASPDYKGMVRDYEKARRRGDTTSMTSLKYLLDSMKEHRMEEMSMMEQAAQENDDRHCDMEDWMKADIEGHEMIIDMLEDYRGIKEYIYRVTEVPSEKIVLGHTFARNAEEKNRGKDYINWYLKQVLEIDNEQLQKIIKDDGILVQFGKELLDSDMESTFKNYYQNRADIKWSNYHLKFYNGLSQSRNDVERTEEDFKILAEYDQKITELNKYLQGYSKRSEIIENEFTQKEAKLSEVLQTLVDNAESEEVAVKKNTGGRK